MSATPSKTLTWKELAEFLRGANEQQCADLLEQEKASARRHRALERIYGRFSKLREERERLGLAQVAARGPAK